jgi:hypothetical protein
MEANNTTTDGIRVYTAYAHPIGEDSDVFWLSVGRTPEAARQKIEAEIEEAHDEHPNLDDESEWVFLVSEDTI